MSNIKRLAVVLALLASAVSAAACTDVTGPRPEQKPCENQGSGC